MPSIPQSLLWISLVVLWLFVLVPMLINKRDNVRRTSDVALATRVLNVKASRLLRRRGPAHGHRSDPDWQPEADLDDEYDDYDEDATGPVVVTARVTQVHSVVVMNETVVAEEEDYLDVDIVDEDSGALPVGRITEAVTGPIEVVTEAAAAGQDAVEQDAAEEPRVEAAPEPEPIRADESDEMADDEYQYVEDTSGLEPPAEESRFSRQAPISHGRGYATKTAAAVSARKYRFRSRVLMTMCVLLGISAAAGLALAPVFWWMCAGQAVVTLLYLAYLRRQTRIEERLRRRRMARMARSRLGVENTYDREMDVVPTRLRQPGAVVLEIDDEDLVFEHLEEVAYARHYDLPRAAGQ